MWLLNWLTSTVNWLTSTDVEYTSVVAIGFTINTWTASLVSIRNQHIERIQGKIVEHASRLRDSSLLNVFNNLDESSRRKLEDGMRKALNTLHCAESLPHTLLRLERWFRLSMVGCATIAIGLLIFKCHAHASIFLLLPYPVFVSICWWCCRWYNFRMKHHVTPVLENLKSQVSQVSKQDNLKNMMSELDVMIDKMPSQSQTFTPLQEISSK